jgi:hypothetical protein
VFFVGINKYCAAIDFGLYNYIKAWGFVDYDKLKLDLNFFGTFGQNFQGLFE